MAIYVYKKGTQYDFKHGDFILYHLDWNDWWTYENLYTVKYIRSDLSQKLIGQVKIGQLDQNESKVPDLPDSFVQLDNKRFVSLGQDPSYYDELIGAKSRDDFLHGMNDIAFDLSLLKQNRHKDVVARSLTRDFSYSTVENQFARIAHGGAILSSYHFEYIYPSHENQNDARVDTTPRLEFCVEPGSNPPSNIHVLIGRNGVGKTWLIRKMLDSLYNEDDKSGHFEFSDRKNRFANVVCLAFSVFDEFPTDLGNDSLQYTYIGVKSKFDGQEVDLNKQFAISMTTCMTSSSKYQRWKETIKVLDSDPVFFDADLSERIDHIQNNKKTYTRKKAEEEIGDVFQQLSSGHKIVTLAITRLVETVEECTLVLIDEPELHLHPPLLAAFTRALSQLMINRNGVAIVSTHSPVVLQEVPRNCVWVIQRSGREVAVDRPGIETFGENVGTLTSEVFRLEVMASGFHKMLEEVIAKQQGDFELARTVFDNQLGSEALALLKVLSLQFGGE